MKILRLATIAASGIVAAVALMPTAAEAQRCREQFSHTTCTWGPWGTCKNHFKTVCSDAVVKHTGGASPAGVGKPIGQNFTQATQSGIKMGVKSCIQLPNGLCR